MSDHFPPDGQPDNASGSGVDTPAFPPLAAAPPAIENFSFTGRGAEYFRIWIVNLLLSVVTLGIYSAWAKVRRLRYFYDNTVVAGTSFEYHGNPIAILKGRAIALALIVTFKLIFNFNPVIHLNPMVSLALLAVLMAAVPWLIWKTLQFKLYNTSYRGIRFGFRGSAGGAYRSYLLWPLLTMISVYLLAPMAHQRIKRFQHNESRFGTSHFSFHGSVASFYKAYLVGLGAWLGGIAAILILFGSSLFALLSGSTPDDASVGLSIGATVLLLYGWSFIALPLFLTLIQNLIWNHTRLGEHRFQSRMRWSRASFILITNLIGIACTLGLYTPFAQVRMMRYRIESMSLLPASQLDEFVAASDSAGSAAGEGLTDLLDFDLSL